MHHIVANGLKLWPNFYSLNDLAYSRLAFFRDSQTSHLPTVDNVVVEIEPNDIFIEKNDNKTSTKGGQREAGSDVIKKSVRKILPKSSGSLIGGTGGLDSGNLAAFKSSSSSQVIRKQFRAFWLASFSHVINFSQSDCRYEFLASYSVMLNANLICASQIISEMWV